MSVTTTATNVEYSPGGGTTEFSVPFKFDANTDIVAVLTDADGNDTTWALTTDYTLTGAGNVAGGTLTAVTAPASGTTLFIYRDTSETQSQLYVDNDAFPATSHEAALDKLTLLVQELQTQVNQSLRIPRNESTTTLFANAASRASKYPVFDANGNLTTTTEATISYPDDDVGISYTFVAGGFSSTFNLTITNATSSRLVRVWINDDAETAPTTTVAAYNVAGSGQKYFEFIASNGANALTLPAATVAYRVTFEFQGAVFISDKLEWP